MTAANTPEGTAAAVFMALKEGAVDTLCALLHADSFTSFRRVAARHVDMEALIVGGNGLTRDDATLSVALGVHTSADLAVLSDCELVWRFLGLLQQTNAVEREYSVLGTVAEASDVVHAVVRFSYAGGLSHLRVLTLKLQDTRWLAVLEPHLLSRATVDVSIEY